MPDSLSVFYWCDSCLHTKVEYPYGLAAQRCRAAVPTSVPNTVQLQASSDAELLKTRREKKVVS
jgi:hypothetical protein